MIPSSRINEIVKYEAKITFTSGVSTHGRPAGVLAFGFITLGFGFITITASAGCHQFLYGDSG